MTLTVSWISVSLRGIGLFTQTCVICLILWKTKYILKNIRNQNILACWLSLYGEKTLKISSFMWPRCQMSCSFKSKLVKLNESFIFGWTILALTLVPVLDRITGCKCFLLLVSLFCLLQAPWAQPWQSWSQAWGYNGSHISSCPGLTHLVKQVGAAYLLKHKYFQLVPSDASRLLPPHRKADSLFEIRANRSKAVVYTLCHWWLLADLEYCDSPPRVQPRLSAAQGEQRLGCPCSSTIWVSNMTCLLGKKSHGKMFLSE